MNKRQLLYFFLAALPALLTGEQPQYAWKWFVWIGTALYQGLLALKALDSQPTLPSSAAQSLNRLTELTNEDTPVPAAPSRTP